MPRVSIDVSDRLMRRLRRCFPWGTQSVAIRRVLELMCDRVEVDGVNVLEKLISGVYDPLDAVTTRERIKS